MPIISPAAHRATPNGSSDTLRSFSFIQKSTVHSSAYNPLEHKLVRIYDKWASPWSHSHLLTQLTFLTLWPLCPTERRLLTTGSYFSCTFGEMGNKKMKRTHWGKIISGLNCWHNKDESVMSQTQIIGHRMHANDSSCKNLLVERETESFLYSYYVLGQWTRYLREHSSMQSSQYSCEVYNVPIS